MVVRQPAALTRVIGAEADVRRPPPALDAHAPAVTRQSQQPVRPGPAAASSGLPLAGITIVELAVQFAAPYGATVLTDLGARVIKVEPLSGDIIRTMMAFPEAGGAKAMQGKDSICVDITTEEGADIVRKCAARADIILDGFRPGAAERRGLGPESLRAINPDLVYVSASGYGEGGPYSNRPAFAPSIGAAGGITRANLGDAVQETSGLSPEQVLEASMRLFAGSSILQAQASCSACWPGSGRARASGCRRPCSRRSRTPWPSMSSTPRICRPRPSPERTCAGRARCTGSTTLLMAGSSWPSAPTPNGTRWQRRCARRPTWRRMSGSPRQRCGRPTTRR
jgi:hypothetical protein